MTDQDPALSQEDAPEDANTVVDPPTTEAEAEPSEKSGEGAEPQQDGKETTAAEEEFDITIAGEEPPAPPKESAAWARIRKENAELKAWKAEQERQRQAQAQSEQAADPGPEPTFADCDFDEAKLKRAHVEWLEKKSRKAALDAEAVQRSQAAQRTWDERLGGFAKGREEMSKKFPGYSDAEATVKAALDVNRMAAIVESAKNPALVIAALGRNPTELERLSKEPSLARFIAGIAILEVGVKMQKKTTPPPPEKKIRGGGSVSGADSRLEELRAQAAESGDYTALNDHKRALRQQKKR